MQIKRPIHKFKLNLVPSTSLFRPNTQATVNRNHENGKSPGLMMKFTFPCWGIVINGVTPHSVINICPKDVAPFAIMNIKCTYLHKFDSYNVRLPCPFSLQAIIYKQHVWNIDLRRYIYRLINWLKTDGYMAQLVGYPDIF